MYPFHRLHFKTITPPYLYQPLSPSVSLSLTLPTFPLYAKPLLSVCTNSGRPLPHLVTPQNRKNTFGYNESDNKAFKNVIRVISYLENSLKRR